MAQLPALQLVLLRRQQVSNLVAEIYFEGEC